MKVQEAVKTETKKIALGVSMLSAVMVIVFLVSGRFYLTVLWGAVLGSFAAVANFFFMAMTVQKIAGDIHGVKKRSADERQELLSRMEPEMDGEEADEDPLLPEEEADLAEQTRMAKAKMQRSYGMRMLFMVVIGVIGLKIDFFHPIAVLVPFLFPRLVIMLYSLPGSRKGA